jgi:hypothetical protein
MFKTITKVCGFIILSTSSFLCFSQNQTNTKNVDSTEHYLLDFSVPDMPAFKALGTDPSNIIRPSDIQKFAAQISPFYSGSKAVIPQNFALEIAPWKLASKKWTLDKYSTGINSVLYNSAFSIGTLRDTSKYNSKLSIGYRFTITGKNGDILKSAKNKKAIIDYMMTMQGDVAVIENDWVNTVVIKTKNIPVTERLQYINNHKAEFYRFLATDTNSVKDPEIKAVLREAYAAFHTLLTSLNIKMKDLTKDSTIFLAQTNISIDKLINDFKAKKWNATRTDVAFAWVGASSDSLLKNAQFSSFNAWITQSIAVHDGGQLLLGVNCMLPRTERVDSVGRRINFTGNMRYYVGTSDIRGFVELQYKYKNSTAFNQTLLLNLGAEFRVDKNFWIIANAGINNYLGEKNPWSKFVSSVNIRYAFNKPNKSKS